MSTNTERADRLDAERRHICEGCEELFFVEEIMTGTGIDLCYPCEEKQIAADEGKS